MSILDKVLIFKNVLNTVLKIVDLMVKCIDYIVSNTDVPEA